MHFARRSQLEPQDRKYVRKIMLQASKPATNRLLNSYNRIAPGSGYIFACGLPDGFFESKAVFINSMPQTSGGKLWLRRSETSIDVL